jgi:hypothetical protein
VCVLKSICLWILFSHFYILLSVDAKILLKKALVENKKKYEMQPKKLGVIG